MARLNVSVDELLKTLDKVGAPYGSGQQMQLAQPQVRSALSNQSRANDPMLIKQREEYMKKINAIAAMDQKLAGVYSDPSSKLYIEHAGARERAITAPRSTGMRELKGIQSDIGTREKQLDQIADEAFTLYKQITTQQKSLESKVGKTTGKTSTAKLSPEDKIAQNALKEATFNVAGLTDLGAQAAFDSKPTAFQRFWIRKIINEEAVRAYTARDINKIYTEWKKIASPKTTPAKNFGEIMDREVDEELLF